VLEATTLPLPETGRGTIEVSAIEAVLEKAATVEAVAIGPGLSTDEETVQFIRKLVGDLEKPLVMDADAVNAFAGDAAAIGSRVMPTVLTPHPGEMGRLLGMTTAEVIADRSGAAVTAAAISKAVVLLKGYRSLVISPAAQEAIIPTGGPGLATGGTGDVLTGIVVALLAAGHDPFEAAWAGAWIHGRAGDILTSKIGQRSMIAGDLVDVLQSVVSSLEALWSSGNGP
ncbi:MAG: NAD(P)H-hydrate dehydratase, partial [Acidimicrobiia bacterium]